MRRLTLRLADSTGNIGFSRFDLREVIEKELDERYLSQDVAVLRKLRKEGVLEASKKSGSRMLIYHSVNAQDSEEGESAD